MFFDNGEAKCSLLKHHKCSLTLSGYRGVCPPVAAFTAVVGQLGSLLHTGLPADQRALRAFVLGVPGRAH